MKRFKPVIAYIALLLAMAQPAQANKVTTITHFKQEIQAIVFLLTHMHPYLDENWESKVDGKLCDPNELDKPNHLSSLAHVSTQWRENELKDSPITGLLSIRQIDKEMKLIGYEDSLLDNIDTTCAKDKEELNQKLDESFNTLSKFYSKWSEIYEVSYSQLEQYINQWNVAFYPSHPPNDIRALSGHGIYVKDRLTNLFKSEQEFIENIQRTHDFVRNIEAIKNNNPIYVFYPEIYYDSAKKIRHPKIAPYYNPFEGHRYILKEILNLIYKPSKAARDILKVGQNNFDQIILKARTFLKQDQYKNCTDGHYETIGFYQTSVALKPEVLDFLVGSREGTAQQQSPLKVVCSKVIRSNRVGVTYDAKKHSLTVRYKKPRNENKIIPSAEDFKKALASTVLFE